MISKVDVEVPLFQPFPHKIGFHKYEANKTYEQILWFRNNDYVPRRIKIENPSSPDFSVRRMRGKKGEKLREFSEESTTAMASQSLKNGRPSADVSIGKVAPGMEVAFKVRFTPKDREDYTLDLVCVTEREKFLVPVQCVGDKPALDFPDTVTFEPTPAKCKSIVTRVIRNVGSKVSHFRFFVPEPFAVFPSEGVLQVGESLQVRLEFYPEQVGQYEATMEVDAGVGVEPVMVNLIGNGCEMRVGLDCGTVEALPTFVGKTTRRTFRVVNRGDRAARFEVKKLADAFLDKEARLRATAVFGGMETDREELTTKSSHEERRGGYPVLNDDTSTASSSYDSDDEDAILGADAVSFAARQIGLQKALQNDALLFEHKHFSVFPRQGEVQPGCEFEITIRFHPDDAGECAAECFVDVEGREDRLPLQLKGQAVGPLAVFNYDALEVGEVFVGAVHQYEVELVNRGEIECTFERIDGGENSGMSGSGRVFSFEPSSGILQVGQSQTITVTLCSETLGVFDESFEFEIAGGERNAFLDFRGRVIGPTFALDCDALNFGVNALGFRNTKTLTIANTCEIPMRFHLKVPGLNGLKGNNNGTLKGNDQGQPVSEFNALPSSGTILPFGSQKIQIEFVPRTERKFNEFLLLDIPGVGDGLAQISVKAEALVANMTVTEPTVSFGEVFSQHEVTTPFVVLNDSPISGRFEILPQDGLSEKLATWQVSPVSGSIQSGDSVKITLTLFPHHTGIIRVPLFVQTIGSKKPPKEVSIEAFSRGPLVSFFGSEEELTAEFERVADQLENGDPLFYGGEPSHDDLLSTSRSRLSLQTQKSLKIKFGKKGVLRDFYESIFVRNDGPVPAEVKAFTRDGKRCFEVLNGCRTFTLDPGEVNMITVKCHMDQTLAHRDALCVMVTEGGTTVVPIDAEGVGSLLTCDDLNSVENTNGTEHIKDVISFGHQLKDRPFSREIVVTNNSRIIQQLIWHNVTADEKRRNAVSDKREYLAMISPSGAHKNFLTDKTDGQIGIVFSVEPERISVLPKTSAVFTLYGLSEDIGETLETLVCKNQSGAPHEQGEVLTMHATAKITLPKLEFSQHTMGFDFEYDADVVDVSLHIEGDDELQFNPSLLTQTRELSFKNVSKTQVTFVIKTSVPFAVDKTEWVLDHDEEGFVVVSFDPEYRGDRNSHEVRSVLQVQYVDVPQIDEVHLGAEVRFPNLSIDAKELHFGAVLNDTTEVRVITLTNDGDVPARYEWVFDVEDPEELLAEESSALVSDASMLSAEDSKLSVANSVVSKRDARRKRLKKRMEASQIEPLGTPLKQLTNPEEVFDVRPIRGLLNPGESEEVEVSYFARADSQISTFAVCEVHGGPSCDVSVSGSAHEIKHDVTPTFFNVGKAQFDRSIDRTLTVTNQGKVTFPFKINLDSVERPGLVICDPVFGEVNGGESFDIKVRVRPGAPGVFSETFAVEIAHFEPVTVRVEGEGAFQSVGLSLDRLEDELTEQLLERAKLKLQRDGPDPDFPDRFREFGVEAPEAFDTDDLVDLQRLAGKPHTAISTLDPSQLEQLRVDAKARAKAIAAPPPRISELRKTVDTATLNPFVHRKNPHGGFNSTCSTGRGVADFLKERAAQRERVRLKRQEASEEKGEGASEAGGGSDEGDEVNVVDGVDDNSQAASHPQVDEEPSRTFDDLLGAEHDDETLEDEFQYQPTQFEIEHEADKERMRDVLLQRERDRAAEKAERLSSGADTTTSSRAESFAGNSPVAYPRPPGIAPGSIRSRSMTHRTTKPYNAREPSVVRSTSFQPTRTWAKETKVNMGSLDVPKDAGSPLLHKDYALLPSDDSYLLGPQHRHNAFGLPPKLPATQSTYFVDFGNVALGSVYRKKFRVQNLGTEQQILTWDKRALHTRGFDVFPEQMPKLAGAPFFAYVDCDLILDTNKECVVGGEFNVDVALGLKGAPRVVVKLKATVDVPAVLLSTTELDFDSVKVGNRLTKHVQLHNDGLVPCEWSVVKPVVRQPAGQRKQGKPLPSKEPYAVLEPFKFVPSRGILQPGERINVKTHFTPLTDNGGDEWNRQHAIRVEHNPELSFVNLKGIGKVADVKCEYSDFDGPLDLGVVVPSAEGTQDGEGGDGTEGEGTPDDADPDAPKKPPTFTERQVWLVNNSRVDVEVFAIDFDEQFSKDETALAFAKGLAGKPPGTCKLFLSPRAAGDSLWPEIQLAEDERLVAEAKRIAEEEAEAAYQLLCKEAAERGEDPPGRPEPDVAEEEAADGNAEEPGDDLPPPPESDGSKNLLVLGAPFAMSAETSKLVADKYGVPVLDIDEIVKAAAEGSNEVSDSALRLLLRTELGLPPLEAGDDEHNPEPDADASGLAQEKSDAENSDESDPVPAEDETSEDDFPEEITDDTPEEGKLTIKTLTRVLKAQVEEGAPFANGFVVHGLAWETVGPETLVKTLRRALGFQKVDPVVPSKPEDADDTWEPVVLEENTFALHSAKRLTVISLAIDDEAAGAREKAEKEEKERVAKESEANEAFSTLDSPAEETANGEETADGEDALCVYERAEDAEAHRQLVESCLPLLGSAVASNTHVCVVSVDSGVCDDTQAILDAAIASGAPEPLHPPDWIPPDELVEIAKVAAKRDSREPVTRFTIFTPSKQPQRPGAAGKTEQSIPEVEGSAQGGDDGDAPAADAAPADGATPPEDSSEENEMLAKTRWTIPAGGATMVLVKFASPEIGDFHSSLAFECVNGTRVETLHVTGKCEYPRVVKDPKVVFGADRVAKTRPDEKDVSHVFVKQNGAFEFGPVLSNLPVPEDGDAGDSGADDAAGDTPDATGEEPGNDEDSALAETLKSTKKQTPLPVNRNVSTFTMVNPSAFSASITFEATPLVDPTSGEPVSETQDTFAVSPNEMLLQPGESKTLTVTAYPKVEEVEGEGGETADTAFDPDASSPELLRAKKLKLKQALVVATIQGNPDPVTFTVTCVPVTPRLAVDFYPERTALRKQSQQEKQRLALEATVKKAEQKKRDRILGTETRRAASFKKPVLRAEKSQARKKKDEDETVEGAEGDPVDTNEPEAEAPPKESETPSEETADEDEDDLSDDPEQFPPGVFFGKRLCGDKKTERRFIVRNDSLLPVKWALEFADDFLEETVSIDEDNRAGSLTPGEEATVVVKFGAVEPTEVSSLITLNVFDFENKLNEPTQVTEIKIEGETWKIDVDVTFPDAPEAAEIEGEAAEDAKDTEAKQSDSKKLVVDFGLVKSVEQVTRKILLTNKGKYASIFKFDLKNVCSNIFTIEPSDGVIEPESEQDCVMTFNVSKCVELTSRETKLVEAPDVSVTISELEPPSTQSKSIMESSKARTKKDKEVVALLEEAEKKEARKRRASSKSIIHTSVHASFAKYSITPRRGVEFGPQLNGADPENDVGKRYFDVTNDGVFPFTVYLFDYGGRDESEGTVNEDGTPKLPPQTEGESLTVGAFTVSPTSAEVEPGSKITFQTTFTPTDDRNFSELLGVHVFDRDPRDQPLGIPYKLSGESCVPGIASNDLVSVFEEHAICELTLDDTLASIGPIDAVYSKLENAFTFGTVIANMEEKNTEEGEAQETQTETEDDGADKPSVTPTFGTSANFKISNPKRVKCVVDVSLAPVGIDGTDGTHPMTLSETSKEIEIPPHEHKYVTVYFAPSGIDKYAATLEATVRDGVDAKSSKFSCTLKGEGALPHITVDEPTFVDPETQAPTVQFPKTALGASKRKQITLRNDGALAAFCRVDVDRSSWGSKGKRNSSPFTIIGSGVTTEIKPGRVKVLDVLYEPRDVCNDTLNATLSVKHNAFETRSIQITGSGFTPDLVFENFSSQGGGHVSNGADGSDSSQSNQSETSNVLRFSDGPVGQQNIETFTLSNVSGKNWRFEFPDFADETNEANDSSAVSKAFSFTPRVGHLPAGQSTTITATFVSTEPVLLGVDSENPPLEVSVKLTPVKSYFEGSQVELEKANGTGTEGEGEAEAKPKAPHPKRVLRPPKWTDTSFTEEYVVETAEETKEESEESKESSKDSYEKESEPPVHANVRKAPRRVKKRFPVPEPAHTLDTASEKVETLKLFAVSAEPDYELVSDPINFKPTLMFQARTHQITLRNVGKSSLPFTCTTFGSTKEVFRLHDSKEDPYEISPASGSVKPGQAQDITIRFAPSEVVECKRTLRVSFPGAFAESDADEAKTDIAMDGKVLRPWCHFLLPESSYLVSGRRPATCVNDIDASCKVVEFSSIGLNVRQIKRFEVLNPTNQAYEFFWEKNFSTSDSFTSTPFKCVTQKGTVAPGKRYEMCFEFSSTDGDSVEQLVTFKAPSVGIAVPFLLVGTVVEPNVAIDTANVNFGKCLVGVAKREHVSLTNHESIPFKFAFENEGFNAGDISIKTPLRFEPSSGTVPPLGSVPITVSYLPKKEGSVNFNVQCSVSRKPNPLRLNVKAEGYLIRELVELEPAESFAVGQLGPMPGQQNKTSVPIKLAPFPARNTLTLGRVTVEDSCSRSVTIRNEGDFPIELEWDLGMNKRISVSPEFFSVAPGDKATCDVVYAPDAVQQLKEYKILLSVMNGRRYEFFVDAESKNPAISFSTRDVQFGQALVTNGVDTQSLIGSTNQTKVITLRNNDDVPFTVDCLFDSSDQSNGDNAAFTIGEVKDQLAPGATCNVPITFNPIKTKRYTATVPFLINGIATTNVKLSGEGTTPKLELTNTKHATRDFGSVSVGQSVTKEITLRNNGNLSVDLSVSNETLRNFADVDVTFAVCVEGNTRFKKLSVAEDDASQPFSLIVPRSKTVTYKLAFAPTKRAQNFQVPFVVDVSGQPTTYSLAMGGCVLVDVNFSRPLLDFGSIVEGVKTTKVTRVQNTGDLGCTFAFDSSVLKKMKETFDVFPASGYVAPGTDQEIRVTFKPGFLESSGDTSKDSYDFTVPCSLDGGENPMELVLTGCCVTESEPSDTIEFKTVVRGSVDVETTITNSAQTGWRLRPVIANDNWKGSNYLEVPAGGEAVYTITYSPLAMSSDEDPHVGTVRFELPDGTVDVRSLRGVADAPASAGTVEKTVPAKKVTSVNVEVKNWLPRRQRFSVNVAFACDDETPNELVTLKGPEHCDVPSNGTRTYPLSFYGYLTGVTTNATVTFTNEDTNEYIAYDVSVTTTGPESQGTFTLRAACRQLATVKIPITNPTGSVVDVTVACTNPRTYAIHEIVTVAPKSKQFVEVGYRPVVVESVADAEVTITSDVLGTFPFALSLSSTQAGPERGVSFTVPLGTAETKHVPFMHFLESACMYSVKWKNGGGKAFTVNESHNAQGNSNPGTGSEESVAVQFEPTTLGQNFRDLLVIKSEEGGEYIVPVSGRCVVPKPIGPVNLTNGSGSLDFKNVFESETEFKLTIDNPAFSVANRVQIIGAKQSKTIAVTYNAPSIDSAPNPKGVTAKLLVTSDKAPGAPWSFYLKATH